MCKMKEYQFHFGKPSSADGPPGMCKKSSVFFYYFKTNSIPVENVEVTSCQKLLK